MAKIELQASDRFPVGTKVGAFNRVGDWFPRDPGGLGAEVAAATVGKDGVLVIDHLELNRAYWIAAEVEDGRPWVRVAMVATTDDGTKPRRQQRVSREQLNAQTVLPAESTIHDPSKYAELSDKASTRIVGGREERVKSAREKEPQPYLKQSDVPADVPQRSATPLGQATPKVDPFEQQPKPRQEDVKRGTPQRSDTATGEATIKPKDEDVPTERQEDVPARTPQRSDTETGEATRKGTAEPRGTALDPTSEDQASGKRPTSPTVAKRARAKKADQTKASRVKRTPKKER